MTTHSEHNAKGHVVIRLSALGDVLLTTGVLRFWHETRGWTFTVITKAAFAPVFTGHPAVCEVITVDETTLYGAALRHFWKALATRFAGAELLDLHGTGRTRLLGWYWKGRVRRYVKKALFRRAFLFSGGRIGRASLRRASVTQRYALAVEQTPPAREALLPAMFLTDAERACGEERAQQLGKAAAKPLVALHPYAAHQGKMWPVKHWQALIEALDARGIAWCIIGQTGQAGPAGQAERIPDVPSANDLTNQCTLRESAALLAACAVLVTGDSGPMHLAGAVATPVVALFGSTTAEWGFYPAGERDVALERTLACRPCTLHGAGTCPNGYACLEHIQADTVAQAVCSVLD